MSTSSCSTTTMRMPKNPTAKSRLPRRITSRRMTQRLIAAVSAPTAEGVLYELDLRLRPSGNKGPVATHIDCVQKYQREDAWTWEHMALTRARAIAGDACLARSDRSRGGGRSWPCRATPAKVMAEASDMRAMIEEEKPPRDLWDIKLVPGGLIDLEFIAQVAVITGKLEGDERTTGYGGNHWRASHPVLPTRRRGGSYATPMRFTWR